MKSLLMKYLRFVLFGTAFFGALKPALAQQNTGLPEWPVATADYNYLKIGSVTPTGTQHQFVDLTTSPPQVHTMTASPKTKEYGIVQAGYDECGKIVFFAMHTGEHKPGQLELFDRNGNALLSAPNGLNASRHDDEIQLVRVPGVTNQWYIIYSCHDQNDDQSGIYKVLNVCYSKVQIINNALTILLKDASFSSETYILGKATSRNKGGYHYLFMQRRSQLSPKFWIDRYKITSSGIQYDQSSPEQTGYWWYLMARGSHIELGDNEKKLCVMARTDFNNQTESYIFDSDNLSAQPKIIKFDNLNIVQPQGVSLPNHFGTFIGNLDRKITSIEFSPNGRYLYFTGGGFEAGNYGNLTYLGQIDLTPNPNNNKYDVRLQIQSVPGWNKYGQGNGFFMVPVSSGDDTQKQNYLDLHHIVSIEKAYNGKIYFTKLHSDVMYAIDSPDSALPVNLTPGDVSPYPSSNIKFNGFVLYLPDQIDGENYITSPDCPNAPKPPCTTCPTSFAPIPGKKYILSAWAKEDGAAADALTYAAPAVFVRFPFFNQFAGPFKPSGVIIEGWQRIQEEFEVPPNAYDLEIELSSVGPGAVYFDDIRIFPTDGNMQSYVYDPESKRLLAKLDTENYSTRYEYDAEGRLVRVKVETEEGIRMIQESRMSNPKN